METFGFDQLEEKFQDILKKSPAIRDRFVAQEAELLMGRVKDNSPVDTGHLRNGWKKTDSEAGSCTVYNNVEYAAHVEFGHRVKTKAGFTGKVVPGAKMLHIGLQDSQRTFQKDAAKILKELVT